MLLFYTSCVDFAFFMPLGVTALLFSPTPMALLGAREGKAWMALGLLSATLALALVFDSWLAFSFLLSHGLLCFGLTLPLGKLEKGSESLLFCTVTSIVSKVLFVAVSVNIKGINPFAVDQDALRSRLYRMYAAILSKGGQEAAFLQEYLNQAVALVPYMLPFFIILYAMFDSFLNYRLCETLQRKREIVFPPLPPFGEWRFPRNLLHVFVFAIVLPFLVESDDWQLWIMLEYNLKLIVNVFFFLQGVALVWWLMQHATRRFFPLLLFIMLVGFFSMQILVMSLAVIGFSDICVDFRSKKIMRA